MAADTYTVIALVYDQPDDVTQVQVQEEIQHILIDTPFHEPVVFVDIVAPVLDMPKVEDYV